MINWRSHAREFYVRFRLQKDRADKWVKLAMGLKASAAWARRWKAEAKYLRTALDNQKSQLEFLAHAVIAAQWAEGRGHLEETGCPWCSAAPYDGGDIHSPACPVFVAVMASSGR